MGDRRSAVLGASGPLLPNWERHHSMQYNLVYYWNCVTDARCWRLHTATVLDRVGRDNHDDPAVLDRLADSIDRQAWQGSSRGPSRIAGAERVGRSRSPLRREPLPRRETLRIEANGVVVAITDFVTTQVAGGTPKEG